MSASRHFKDCLIEPGQKSLEFLFCELFSESCSQQTDRDAWFYLIIRTRPTNGLDTVPLGKVIDNEHQVGSQSLTFNPTLPGDSLFDGRRAA